MSRVSFENYGRLARSALDPTEKAGRYPIQAEAEKRVLPDVLAKTGAGPTDRVLDIGCGSGLLLVPLSYLVAHVTGIDHPDVVRDLGARFVRHNVTLVGGNFLDLDLGERFSLVIAYGVVNCLGEEAELMAFVDKAIACLAPGGRLLLGDIPNVDKKRRFLETAAGRAFEAEWQRAMASSPSSSAERPALDPNVRLLRYDDALVLRLLGRCRGRGLNAYVLPQPPDLPFGLSREDILIERPPA